MQRAYATSINATSLLAETEIILGAARRDDAALPANGASADISLGTPSSLDVLVAPRACEMHVPGQDPYTINLTPRAGVSLQTVVTEALEIAAPSTSPHPTAPKPGKGFQGK